MATLQRFKFLAVRCAIAGSPSRSPSTSPALHLRRRRRRTLKNLIKDTTGGNRLLWRPSSRALDRERPAKEKKKTKPVDQTFGGRTLKDLFVSSPTYAPGSIGSEVREPAGGSTASVELDTIASGGSAGTGTVRPIVALRYRLLRKAWRPVLVAIPE